MRRRDRSGTLAAALLGLLLLVLLFLASLAIGARPIAPWTALQALLGQGGSPAEQVILRAYRLPRSLLGLICGAGFGVAGALIQAATRNPLADPGLLGVNAGAAFFVTLAVGIFGINTIGGHLGFAWLGAALVSLAVHALAAGGRGGATPVRLVLAGVALSAVLSGLGSAIALQDPQAFDSLRFWAAGSIAGRDMAVVRVAAPFAAAGIGLALLLAAPLNALALGEDQARGLGVRVPALRLATLLAVTLLAGTATAAAGPIGFIGLMVPHALRWRLGGDLRWIIGLSALYGAVLLLAADIAGRLLLYPGEMEAGLVTAFLGAPLLILLARRRQAVRG